VTAVTSALVVEAYTEIVSMRYVLKFVGLALVLTLGVLPSIALMGICTVVRSSHPCCPPELALQSAMAMSGPDAPAPCCQFSSGRAAPITESQIQAPTSVASRPSTTTAPSIIPPVRAEVSPEQIRAVVLPPAQSSLCTFVI